MSEQNNNIDFQKLSQRELLIITYKKVTELQGEVTEIAKTQSKHEVRISVMESRVMMWGALFGMLAAGLIEGILSLIKQ